MARKKKKLTINLLTSRIFWSSMPLIIAELAKREHYVSVFDETNKPLVSKLLDCDILIDLSAITDIKFYMSLDKEYKLRKAKGGKVPLMIDSPEAVIKSMDKRETHKLLPDLVPESYNLNGKNNIHAIKHFMGDKYIVIKDPFSWWAKGIDRLSLEEAIKKYKDKKGLIVQKYIPFTDGVGRILTLNYKDDFKVICAYLRIPNSWRTGEGTTSEYKLVKVDKKLYNFAKTVTQRSGIFLNGIDYIYHDDKYILIEVNVAPGFRDPYDEFDIDTPKIIVDFIEKHADLK